MVRRISRRRSCSSTTRRENAHNNFAQIAGELGIVGLISFLRFLSPRSGSRRRRERSDHDVAMPVLLGLAAFILTWLGGHPLLVAEAAYPFWLTLGRRGSARCA